MKDQTFVYANVMQLHFPDYQPASQPAWLWLYKQRLRRWPASATYREPQWIRICCRYIISITYHQLKCMEWQARSKNKKEKKNNSKNCYGNSTNAAWLGGSSRAWLLLFTHYFVTGATGCHNHVFQTKTLPENCSGIAVMFHSFHRINSIHAQTLCMCIACERIEQYILIYIQKCIVHRWNESWRCVPSQQTTMEL